MDLRLYLVGHLVNCVACIAQGLDGDMVSRSTFVLPTLGPKLELLAKDIHEGRGFALIRGLDVTRYTVEDLTLLYLGVQAHIAEKRGRQDARGNMLGTPSASSFFSLVSVPRASESDQMKPQFTSLRTTSPSWVRITTDIPTRLL